MSAPDNRRHGLIVQKAEAASASATATAAAND